MLVSFLCSFRHRKETNIIIICIKIIFLYFLMQILLCHVQNDTIELPGYENVGVDTKIISLCQKKIKKSQI